MSRIDEAHDDPTAPTQDSQSGEPPAVDFGDPGSIAEAAQWLATAVGSGVVGNAAFHWVSALGRRRGKRDSERLYDQTWELLKKVKGNPGRSDRDFRRLLDDIFDRD